MQAIYILWLREMKRYLRSRARLVASLGQPLLYLIAFGYGFGPVFAQAGQGNYIQFLAPGVIGMTVLFTAITSGIGLIWDRQFGFLKETFVAPIPRSFIMIGRTLGGATVAVLQGLIVLLICLALGFRPTHALTLPLALVFMILIAITFTALGTAIGSMLDDLQGFQLIMNFVVMPIFFLSGAIFPVTNLPAVLSAIACMNPLAYGVDGLRFALIGASAFGVASDLSVLALVSVALMMLGSWLFSRIQL